MIVAYSNVKQDSTIADSAYNLTTNLYTLESCLRFLHPWFCHNRLALNSDKSENRSSCYCYGTLEIVVTLFIN